MKPAKLDPLQRLLAPPLKDRLAAVAKDLRARRKKFNKSPSHDLARALGVPQPERPADGWWFATYAEKQTAEEYA